MGSREAVLLRQGFFFKLVEHRARGNTQHPRRIADAAPIEGHLGNPFVGAGQTGAVEVGKLKATTAPLTTIPLNPLGGLTVAINSIRQMTVWTKNRFVNHRKQKYYVSTEKTHDPNYNDYCV